MANARVFAGNVVDFQLHRRFASIIVAVLSFAALTFCLSQTKAAEDRGPKAPANLRPLE